MGSSVAPDFRACSISFSACLYAWSFAIVLTLIFLINVLTVIFLIYLIAMIDCRDYLDF